ncbi:hypothetical protein BGZ83_008983 [Gryganskiella cystojenkinii]|nr:hypothetical protein BGZ83_008983 [Gryganskiella cystojenkinii]
MIADLHPNPWSQPDPEDRLDPGPVLDSSSPQLPQRPQPIPLRSKVSTSSINSDTSTSSNTTFLSTLSFSTTTGAHFRTQTQEELFQNGTGDYDDENHQEDGEDGYDDDAAIDDLDVAILTPRDALRASTFGPPLNLQQQQKASAQSWHDRSQSLDEEEGSIGAIIPVSPSVSKRHIKSYSQKSSDQYTIRGRHSAQASSISLSTTSTTSTTKTSSSKYGTTKGQGSRHDQQHHQQHRSSQKGSPSEFFTEGHQEPHEALMADQEGENDQESSDNEYDQPADMQFASPDYRKSMAPSVQSDLAMDHTTSPRGRGSSVYMTSEAPYTNLLRDATLIIEQQQQQQQHRESEGPSPWIGEDHRDSDRISVTTTSSSSRHPQHTQHSSQHESTLGAALPTSTKSNKDDGIPASLSSKKSTLTRSRSRRFSAPGTQFSSHSSLSSSSRTGDSKKSDQHQDTGVETVTITTSMSSAAPSTVGMTQKYEGRAPQTVNSGDARRNANEDDDDDSDDSYKNPSRITNATKGSSSKHTMTGHHQPLQHHPTMQPTLNVKDDLVSSSTSQHLNQLHQQRHDYRQGVVFEYYEGEWDWLPNFDEMQPVHAGIVGNFMIDDTTERDLFRPQGLDFMSGPNRNRSRPGKESGNFAVRFTTHIDITQDGVYSFWLSSNDGSVLYIANSLVVENDGMHYATEVEGRVLLQAGKHAMTIEFFHKNGKMLEGFRSTGPSLVVSYRKPGPVWSFGLASGPKRVIKSSNLFYDHGDARLRSLLNDFGVDAMDRDSHGGAMSPLPYRENSVVSRNWRQEMSNGSGNPQQGSDQQQQLQSHHLQRPTRHRIMSGDMGHQQPSTRELLVQMENAKTTIKDLEQIIRDQAEAHQKKMQDLYAILQSTQSQVDRLKTGLEKATLFEKPKTTIHQSHTSNPAWRNTVVSIYVDAEEDEYLFPEGSKAPHRNSDDDDYDSEDDDGPNRERQNKVGGVVDKLLAKHLEDLEKLKQMYFFSMALSVKMNCEMLASGKPGVTGAAALTSQSSPEYTSTSVQKLYEDCTIQNKIPVEGWPGFVSRHFASRGRGR